MPFAENNPTALVRLRPDSLLAVEGVDRPRGRLRAGLAGPRLGRGVPAQGFLVKAHA